MSKSWRGHNENAIASFQLTRRPRRKRHTFDNVAERNTRSPTGNESSKERTEFFPFVEVITGAIGKIATAEIITIKNKELVRKAEEMRGPLWMCVCVCVCVCVCLLAYSSSPWGVDLVSEEHFLPVTAG